MKEFRILLALACLAISLSLSAQGDFRPGYIIDLDQDTIYGQIKSNSESRNARTCVFRTGENAAETRFDPGEISAYRIEGGKYYISAAIEEEGEKQQVFLEYLVHGMADLYYLRKENSETYYIRKQGEEAMALTDIRLLKAAFSDCYEIQSSLDDASLSHKSLVDMTVMYHDYVCEGEVCINYSKQVSRLRIEVGPVVGYSIHMLNFKGGDLPFALFEFGNSQVPVFGLQLNLGSDRLGQHLSFQLGAEYSKHSLQTNAEIPGWEYYIDTYTYDAQMESSLLSFSLGSKYAFSGSRVRPFMSGGLMLSKFFNTDLSYTEVAYYINWDPDMETNTWSGNPMANLLYGVYAQLGVDVKLSHKLSLVSSIKVGYQNSNPNTVMALVGRSADQARIRTQLIPLTFLIGVQF